MSVRSELRQLRKLAALDDDDQDGCEHCRGVVFPFMIFHEWGEDCVTLEEAFARLPRCEHCVRHGGTNRAFSFMYFGSYKPQPAGAP